MISDSEFHALRASLDFVFTETCLILRRTVTLGDDGQQEMWNVVSTSPCFVTSNPTLTITETSRMAVDVNVVKVLVPSTTDVRSGDRIQIDTDTYTVTDTDRETTYQLYITCNCRRLE